MDSTMLAAPPEATVERTQVHALVDLLSATQLHAVLPVLRLLAESFPSDTEPSIEVHWNGAPQDEESLRPEVVSRLQESWEELAKGGGFSHDDVLREFVHG